MEINRYLGEKLRLAREKAGLSQRGAGRLIGWTQQAVSELERGGFRLSVERAYRLAQLYKIDPFDLFPSINEVEIDED